MAEGSDEVVQILEEVVDGQIEVEKVSHLGEHDGEALSLDEMEAVAGGAEDRDWLADGCAATVEPGSNCWGTDGWVLGRKHRLSEWTKRRSLPVQVRCEIYVQV